MKKKIEFKNVAYEIKEVKAEEGLIIGYPSVFNVVDLGEDKIEKGAFKKTIKEKKGVWPILINHDSYSRPKIGFNIHAVEDEHGLLTTEKLALDTQAGREQFSLTKMAHDVGGVDALSIGYRPVKEEWDKTDPKRPVRLLKEIEMWEHSHVTFGMNQEAMTEAVKAWTLPDGKIEIGEYTDALFKHMEFMGHKPGDVIEALRAIVAAKVSIDPNEAAKALIQSLNKASLVLKGAG